MTGSKSCQCRICLLLWLDWSFKWCLFVKYPKLISLRTNFKPINLPLFNFKLSVYCTAAKVPPSSDWVLLDHGALHVTDQALPLTTLWTTLWSLDVSPLVASGTPPCPAFKKSFFSALFIYTSFLWCFQPLLYFEMSPSLSLCLSVKSYFFFMLLLKGYCLLLHEAGHFSLPCKVLCIILLQHLPSIAIFYLCICFIHWDVNCSRRKTLSFLFLELLVQYLEPTRHRVNVEWMTTYIDQPVLLYYLLCMIPNLLCNSSLFALIHLQSWPKQWGLSVLCMNYLKVICMFSAGFYWPRLNTDSVKVKSFLLSSLYIL